MATKHEKYRKLVKKDYDMGELRDALRELQEIKELVATGELEKELTAISDTLARLLKGEDMEAEDLGEQITDVEDLLDELGTNLMEADTKRENIVELVDQLKEVCSEGMDLENDEEDDEEDEDEDDDEWVDTDDEDGDDEVKDKD